MTAREWVNHKINIENPCFDDLQEFLRVRADFLENYEANTVQIANKRENHVRQGHRVHLSSKVACYHCRNSDHYIYRCEEFLKLSVGARIDRMKQLKLCINCLGKEHNAVNCKLGPCRKCKTVKHNSLLHQDSSDRSHGPVALYSSVVDSVLLSTAVIDVFDSSCRVILDSGFQSNYVTKALCDALNIPLQRTNFTVTGVNNVTSSIKYKCIIRISSRTTNFARIIACFVVPTIIGKLPTVDFDVDDWNTPANIQLADSQFNISGAVDLLIGASLFWEIILPGKMKLSRTRPILQNSLFGWIVCGTINQANNSSVCCFSTQAASDLHNSLQQYWELEDCSSSNLLSSEQSACEQFFLDTYCVDSDGRFVVKLPLKG